MFHVFIALASASLILVVKLSEVCIAIVTIVVCYTTKILSIKYKKKLRLVFRITQCSCRPNVPEFLLQARPIRKTNQKFPNPWRAFHGDCSGIIFLILERWSVWNRSRWWNSNWFNATKTNQHWQMGLIDTRCYTFGQVTIFHFFEKWKMSISGHFRTFSSVFECLKWKIVNKL